MTVDYDAPRRTAVDTAEPLDELARRREGWQPLPHGHTRGVLAKYSRLVGSASKGAVCD